MNLLRVISQTITVFSNQIGSLGRRTRSKPTVHSRGSILGGVTASVLAKNKFKSIATVIKEDMTSVQREQLGYRVMQALQGFDITDMTMFLPLLLNNQSAQMAAIKAVVNFLEQEMRLQVTNGL